MGFSLRPTLPGAPRPPHSDKGSQGCKGKQAKLLQKDPAPFLESSVTPNIQLFLTTSPRTPFKPRKSSRQPCFCLTQLLHQGLTSQGPITVTTPSAITANLYLVWKQN